jgi:hypothetical protein
LDAVAKKTLYRVAGLLFNAPTMKAFNLAVLPAAEEVVDCKTAI